MTNIERSKYAHTGLHIVKISPWPIVVSFSLISFILTLLLTIHGIISNIYYIIILLIILLISILLWFRDILSESIYIGDHTLQVRKGIYIGFIIFIIVEVLTFGGLFWGYLHSSINPDIILGNIWPPKGLILIQPLDLPFLNTIILLVSGITITWSHYSFIIKNKYKALLSLFLTILLILIFILCQYYEYNNALFTITDGVYASMFYLGTGLHFLHIIILLIILIISFSIIYFNHTINTHHLAFEITILYLHCLDIIWLFLYIIYYWWGI